MLAGGEDTTPQDRAPLIEDRHPNATVARVDPILRIMRRRRRRDSVLGIGLAGSIFLNILLLVIIFFSLS